jgi:hypothetical protein
LKQMTNTKREANFISAKWSMDDSSVFSIFFFFLYTLWYIVVFRIKIYIRIAKKDYVYPFDFFFDGLALRPLGLYGNLLGPFVAYS